MNCPKTFWSFLVIKKPPRDISDDFEIKQNITSSKYGHIFNLPCLQVLDQWLITISYFVFYVSTMFQGSKNLHFSKAITMPNILNMKLPEMPETKNSNKLLLESFSFELKFLPWRLYDKWGPHKSFHQVLNYLKPWKHDFPSQQ